MGEVIPIHSRRTFSLEEAESLLPIVRRITERAALEVRDLQEQLRFVPHGEGLHQRLAAQADVAVRRWAIKISQLGCEPRGIWLVDFDAGSGWFSWRLGDERLAFFHAHDLPARAALTATPGEFPS